MIRKNWRLLHVLCFDLTYLCNKDENRWKDNFFASEELIHRFPLADEHTHGLGFDDWVTITSIPLLNESFGQWIPTQCWPVIATADQCIDVILLTWFDKFNKADQCGCKYVNEVSSADQCTLQCWPVRAQQCWPVRSPEQTSAYPSALQC